MVWVFALVVLFADGTVGEYYWSVPGSGKPTIYETKELCDAERTRELPKIAKDLEALPVIKWETVCAQVPDSRPKPVRA